MEIKNKKIGIIFENSIASIKNIIPIIKELQKKKGKVFPIMFNNSNTYWIEKINNSSKYNKHNENKKSLKINKNELLNKVSKICNKKIFTTIDEFNLSEVNHLMDVILIIPADKNIISKLCFNLLDSFELEIINIHLKNDIPVIIAPLVDNGLGAGAINIGMLLNRKNYYFVPFKQRNPITNPQEISFDWLYVISTIECALNHEQIEPLLL